MSDDKDKILDLDDPSLKEPQEYDPEADTEAFIPAPELDENGNAKDYLLKLSLGENKLGTKKMYFKKDKNGNPFGVLMVDLSIVDPGGAFDKFKLGGLNGRYPNTIVQSRSGGSPITNLCRLLKEAMPPKLSLEKQAAHVESLIAAEPTLMGNIQWKAYCTNCQEEVSKLTGERNWPEKKNEAGQVIGHIPKAECPTCKADVTPGVELKKFIDLT